MSSHHQPRLFHIANLFLKADKKASKVYVVFSVKGRTNKEETDLISAQADGLGFCWQDRVIEIEIPDPTRAELQVKAFSKRTILPDRLLGEFALTLAHPGATANLSGELKKKGVSHGTVSFKIYPAGKSNLHHGVVVSNRNSAYPAAQTLQQPQNPGQSQAESSGVEGKGEPVAGQTEAGAIPVANEPQVRTEPVTYETEGAPVASNSIEGKLAKFREDMQEGKHDPHHRSQAAPGTNQGQGAFSRKMGLPEEAGTAADGDHSIPRDTSVAGGGAAGPVAPTGQGGVLSPGVTPVGTEQAGGSKTDSTTKSAAVAATKNTEGALESAKQAFSGPN